MTEQIETYTLRPETRIELPDTENTYSDWVHLINGGVVVDMELGEFNELFVPVSVYKQQLREQRREQIREQFQKAIVTQALYSSEKRAEGVDEEGIEMISLETFVDSVLAGEQSRVSEQEHCFTCKCFAAVSDHIEENP